MRAEVKSRFQRQVTIDSPRAEDAALAFSYLQVHVPFAIPFFENTEEFPFRNSGGELASVGSFGIRQKDDYAYFSLREQVGVLYLQRPQDVEVSAEEGSGTGRAPMDWYTAPEFVIDLCRDSSPCQVIVARIPARNSFAEVLQDVEAKISQGHSDRISPVDVVLVPNVNFEIVHRFRELEGPDRRFTSPGLKGYHFDAVMQTVRFTLDRSAAEVRSEVKLPMLPTPVYYLANRPFLICIKKRGRANPFFAMWVDNAELLSKPRPTGESPRDAAPRLQGWPEAAMDPAALDLSHQQGGMFVEDLGCLA